MSKIFSIVRQVELRGWVFRSRGVEPVWASLPMLNSRYMNRVCEREWGRFLGRCADLGTDEERGEPVSFCQLYGRARLSTCVEPEICRRGLVQLADASRLPNMFTPVVDAPPRVPELELRLAHATLGRLRQLHPHHKPCHDTPTYNNARGWYAHSNVDHRRSQSESWMLLHRHPFVHQVCLFLSVRS